MSDLTDAELEAMEQRYEAALKALYRADELIDPSCWGYDQIEAVQDLAADLPALIAALREARGERKQEIHLVFDGPPEHVAGRFVEAENSAGESISVGRWEQRGEYWHLIIPRAAEVERLRATTEELLMAIKLALKEIGFPNAGYPAPLVNAGVILKAVLDRAAERDDDDLEDRVHVDLPGARSVKATRVGRRP